MSRTVIKDYNIPAGAALPLYIPGEFFFLLESVSDVDIEFIRNDSTFATVAGVGFNFGKAFSKQPFEGLKISSSDGSAQTVKLAISDDQVFYQNILSNVNISNTPNVITVAEGTLAGDRFMSSEATASGSGGPRHLQMWNPAASGVNVIVERVLASITATEKFSIGYNQVALTDLLTEHNMLIAGAAPLAEMREQTLAVGGITWLSQELNMVANEDRDILQSELVLPPGYGAVVKGSANSTGVAAWFEWREKAV